MTSVPWLLYPLPLLPTVITMMSTPFSMHQLARLVTVICLLAPSVPAVLSQPQSPVTAESTATSTGAAPANATASSSNATLGVVMQQLPAFYAIRTCVPFTVVVQNRSALSTNATTIAGALGGQNVSADGEPYCALHANATLGKHAPRSQTTHTVVSAAVECTIRSSWEAAAAVPACMHAPFLCPLAS